MNHPDSDIRLAQARDDDADIATPRLAVNKRFAENSNTLYRNSPGHGGVACEACNGLNLEGTVLSQTADDRTFLRDEEDDEGGAQTIDVARDIQVSCTLCHEKP